MDALYLAGHFAKDGRQSRPDSRALDRFYEDYRPNPLRHLLPLLSAFGTVGIWLLVLGLIPR
jgi:hypothetical protein